MADQPERWADIKDAREQCEAALETKLADWQWDYIQHIGRGEMLVRLPGRRLRYGWVKQEGVV